MVEYGEFERVGGEKTLHCNVRIIGAANTDLPALAKAGKFRADLLDRLAFEVITLPPLRARWEDIPILAQHFATAMARELGEDRFAGFGREGMRILMEYDWPGNVRELKSAVERAVARQIRQGQTRNPLNQIILDPFASPWRPQTARDEQTAQSPQEVAPPTPKDDETPFGVQVSRLEVQLLRAALEKENGHQGRAAKRLGLSYDQLRHYMRKHHIKPQKS